MKLALKLALMLFACGIRGAELPANLPPHPRLLFSRSDIPRKLMVAEQPVSARLAHLVGIAGNKFAIEHIAL